MHNEALYIFPRIHFCMNGTFAKSTTEESCLDLTNSSACYKNMQALRALRAEES